MARLQIGAALLVWGRNTSVRIYLIKVKNLLRQIIVQNIGRIFVPHATSPYNDAKQQRSKLYHQRLSIGMIGAHQTFCFLSGNYQEFLTSVKPLNEYFSRVFNLKLTTCLKFRHLKKTRAQLPLGVSEWNF